MYVHVLRFLPEYIERNEIPSTERAVWVVLGGSDPVLAIFDLFWRFWPHFSADLGWFRVTSGLEGPILTIFLACLG